MEPFGAPIAFDVWSTCPVPYLDDLIAASDELIREHIEAQKPKT
jgi:hypothetical protein